jgi:hypothetical protein
MSNAFTQPNPMQPFQQPFSQMQQQQQQQHLQPHHPMNPYQQTFSPTMQQQQPPMQPSMQQQQPPMHRSNDTASVTQGVGRTARRRPRTGGRASTMSRLWSTHADKIEDYLRILDNRHTAVVALHKLERHTALQESPISSVMFSPDRKLMTMSIHQEHNWEVPGPIGMRTGTNEENAPLPEDLTEVARDLQQTLTRLGELKRRARMEVNKSINELRGFDAKEAEETAQAQASAQDKEHADFGVDALMACLGSGN